MAGPSNDDELLFDDAADFVAAQVRQRTWRQVGDGGMLGDEVTWSDSAPPRVTQNPVRPHDAMWVHEKCYRHLEIVGNREHLMGAGWGNRRKKYMADMADMAAWALWGGR
eukprot:152741-Chlamydomonas_euryale.AAC.1